ncbi:hypothetical protein BaRGS_00034636 [Batillaria attramentaria]|uniref:Succinate dehydrogenase assembly factor 2, mitochondrial n=1 Tax=Batillaria attramentaria TaxID=370345 RepID=A0ABD0JI74_9CAEN
MLTTICSLQVALTSDHETDFVLNKPALCVTMINSQPPIYTKDTEPPLPQYKERVGEDEDLMRSRLLYQSRKRGMLENGLLLSSFASKFLDTLNSEQLKLYDTLINKPTNDWELYYWMTGNKPTPEEFDNEVMNMLKEHAQNHERESRIRQPDLPVE